jgi:hypothetical protein
VLNRIRRQSWSLAIAATVAACSIVGANLVGTPALAQEQYFSIVNASNTAIEEAFVTQSDSAGWGLNVLSEPMNTGEIRNIPVQLDPANCRYDIHVRSVLGSYAEMNDLNLCDTNTVTVHESYITAQ